MPFDSTRLNMSTMQRGTMSDDFSGLVIIFDPEGSRIAEVMGVKEKGKYALKVR